MWTTINLVILLYLLISCVCSTIFIPHRSLAYSKLSWLGYLNDPTTKKEKRDMSKQTPCSVLFLLFWSTKNYDICIFFWAFPVSTVGQNWAEVHVSLTNSNWNGLDVVIFGTDQNNHGLWEWQWFCPLYHDLESELEHNNIQGCSQ